MFWLETLFEKEEANDKGSRFIGRFFEKASKGYNEENNIGGGGLL